MKLLDLALAYDKALDELAEDDGPKMIQEVQNTEWEFSAKVDAWVRVIRSFEKEFNEAKEMAAAFKKKRESISKALDGAKNYLKGMIENGPSVPYKGTIGGFRVQKNSSPALDTGPLHLSERAYRHVVDEHYLGLVPDEYLKPVSFYVLDAEKVKKDLAEGKDVIFARLVHGTHLRVTV